MILLDTHVLVALRAGDTRLGRRSRAAIEKAHQKGEVALSAISFWEVAMLAQAGRLRLSGDIEAWRRAVLDDGVVEIPVDGRIGIRAMQLLPAHPDPADRMIVATAALSQATLYTADGVLLEQTLPIEAVDSRR